MVRCHTALAYLVLLRMEVAPFHPSACAKTRLCGPLRHVAVPGRYPASRSAEPGLSSTRIKKPTYAAAAWPTPIAILSSKAESKRRQGGDHAQTPVLLTA